MNDIPHTEKNILTREFRFCGKKFSVELDVEYALRHRCCVPSVREACFSMSMPRWDLCLPLLTHGMECFIDKHEFADVRKQADGIRSLWHSDMPKGVFGYMNYNPVFQPRLVDMHRVVMEPLQCKVLELFSELGANNHFDKIVRYSLDERFSKTHTNVVSAALRRLSPVIIHPSTGLLPGVAELAACHGIDLNAPIFDMCYL